MTSLSIPDPAERDDLGTFAARVVRLDQAAPVRLRAAPATGLASSPSDAGAVTAWAPTPFDVLATRSVRGVLEPPDVTVPAAALLAALAVDPAATVDPGAGTGWPGELPPGAGWTEIEDVPSAELELLAERGLAVARESAGPHGPPAALLDQAVLTVSAGGKDAVKVPLRCLFALSAMGFLGAGSDIVRVSANRSWLRLDARYGAVVRRRTSALPLVVL